MLAALVFVAIFVMLISSYRLIAPLNTVPSQPASAALTLGEQVRNTVLPEACVAGAVHTIDMYSEVPQITSATCFVPDSTNPLSMIAGPDAHTQGCKAAAAHACTIRYCPPQSFLLGQRGCMPIHRCDPAQNSTCVRAALQAALASDQAKNIIATTLINDRGATVVDSLGTSSSALIDILSPSGRATVLSVIDATAQAAESEDLRTEIMRINDHLQRDRAGASAEPIAYLSCQPQAVEPGMTIGIAYGCSNATKSVVTGFSTVGRQWGTAQVRIDESSAPGTVTYGLSCMREREVAHASCTIAIEKPMVLLSTSPQGSIPLVAWLARGVQSCMLSSENTELADLLTGDRARSGLMQLPAQTMDSVISIECISHSGNVVRAEAIVQAER